MSCQSRCLSESEQFWALPGLQGCPADESGEVSQEHRHAVGATGEEPARQFVQDLPLQALLEFYGERLPSRSMGNHLFVVTPIYTVTNTVSYVKALRNLRGTPA